MIRVGTMDKVTRALVNAQLSRQESETKNRFWKFIAGSEEDARDQEKSAMEKRQREREMEREKVRRQYRNKYEIKKHTETGSEASKPGNGRVMFGAESLGQNAKGIETRAEHDNKFLTGMDSRLKTNSSRENDNSKDGSDHAKEGICCYI